MNPEETNPTNGTEGANPAAAAAPADVATPDLAAVAADVAASTAAGNDGTEPVAAADGVAGADTPAADTGATSEAPAGVPGVDSPIDFTTEASATHAGLSMADSLASAEDNLTSAGLAAKDNSSDAIGLEEIGQNDPSASMARPDEPLIPAAPVPGSIGSATSGPVPGTPEAAAATAAAAEAPAGAPTPGAEMAAAMEAAMATPAQAPFNPFMPAPEGGAQANPAMAANPMTSSTQVPEALKPKTEKFSKKEGGKSNILTIILAGLAVIGVGAAIIFAILWMQAKDKTNTVYLPSNPANGAVDEEGEKTQATGNATVVCSRPGGEDMTAGIEGLVSATATQKMLFTNGKWQKAESTGVYKFTDAAAVETVLPQFELLVSLLTLPGTDDQVLPVVATYDVDDTEVTLKSTVDVQEMLEVDASRLDEDEFPRDEDGELINDPEVVKAHYVEMGYTCE